MFNADDFWNNIDYGADVLYSIGTDLATRFGGQSLQSLETNNDFMLTVVRLRLEMWMPQAAAMVASSEVGIRSTSDGLRVALAYLSTNEDDLTRLGNRVYWIALGLSAQCEAAAASMKK